MDYEARLGGQLQVLCDGRDCGLAPNKTVATLLLGLLSRSNRWTGRSELVQRLYPEADAEAGRVALRQSLHRLRVWLGPQAIEARGDCIRVGSGWTCSLTMASGQAAPPHLIAPMLEHPWIDEIRREWLPSKPDSEPVTKILAEAVRATALEDPVEARKILVGGQTLLWQMTSANASDLIAIVRPRKWTDLHAYSYLEVRAHFAFRVCDVDTAVRTFKMAYRVAGESKQLLDQERIASFLLFALLERGDLAGAADWRHRLGKGAGYETLVSNALAADAWNRNNQGLALEIMRTTAKHLAGTENADRRHFWANYSVLAAECGLLSESEDAEAECHASGPGFLDARWSDCLRYARCLRLIHSGNVEEAGRHLTDFAEEKGAKGWRMSSLYAQEITALAKLAAGDRTGARQAWSKASVLRSDGHVSLNPRRRAMHQRIRAAN